VWYWYAKMGKSIAKNIVIATGADKLPVDIPYITIGWV